MPINLRFTAVKEVRFGDWKRTTGRRLSLSIEACSALIAARCSDRLRKRLPQASLVVFRHGRLVGFSLGRDGRVMTQIGPIAAADDDAAIMLLAAALSAVSGQVAG